MLKLPPPVWMLIYLLVAGGISAVVPWRTTIPLASIPLGAILILLGLAVAIWAALLFRRVGTEINPTSESNRTLVTSGPFRLTRNPMYVGLVFQSLGIAFCVGSPTMFAVPLLVFATAKWVHIPYEEAKMRRQFGEAFDGYARRTRRWL